MRDFEHEGLPEPHTQGPQLLLPSSVKAMEDRPCELQVKPWRTLLEVIKEDLHLTEDKVRYLGEAVAVVAAVDEETAEEATERNKVEYKEQPVRPEKIVMALKQKNDNPHER